MDDGYRGRVIRSLGDCRYLKIPIAALAILFTGTPAHAQFQGKLIVIQGPCDKKSSVQVGGNEASPYACDTAVVARTDSGSILVQFADKTGVDGRILGFAGEFEGRQGFAADPLQALIVERLYLKAGGEALPVDRGTCFLTWKARKLVMIACGARSKYQGEDIMAIAGLKAGGK